MNTLIRNSRRFFSMLCLMGLWYIPQPARALPLLQDSFNAENAGVGVENYQAFANFNVTSGSVDLIGNGFADFFPGNGLYIDLDGTTGTGATLESKQTFVLEPGIDYTLQFDLGNPDDTFGGGSTDNSVTVSLGSAYSEIFTRNGLVPFATIMRHINVAGTVNATLAFAQSGGDNLGVLLDNVSLQAVPEPTSASLLLIGGVMLLGRIAWERRRKLQRHT